MKQKTDQYMSSENLKSKISVYLIAILIVIGIWCLNYLSPERSDDYIYKFSFIQNLPNNDPVDINYPIKNLRDIITSQYNHYFIWNGRIFTHIIVQLFTGLLGKQTFNFFNAIIFILFIYSLLIYSNYKKTALNLLFITAIIFFLFPDFRDTVLWMTGSINYLWPCTFICFILIVIKKNQNKKYHPIDLLWFIPSFLIGWMHEGITAPLAGSMVLYALINWKSIRHSVPIILILGFFCGAVICSFSPAIIKRSGVTNYSLSEFLISKSIGFFVIFSELKAFWVLILCIIIRIIIHKENIWLFLKHFYKSNLIECNALLFSFGINFLSNSVALRAAIGVEFFSLILILKIFRNLKINAVQCNYYKLAICCGLIILYGFVLKYSLISHENNLNLTSQLENSRSKVITFENLKIPKLIKPYIVNPTTHYSINPKDISNRIFCFLYPHNSLIFIPNKTYDLVKHSKGFPIPLSYQKDSPFYILPIDKEEIDDIKVFFILRPTNQSEIPFYFKPFASKLQRYNASKIESPHNNNCIIQIDGKSYLLVSKNSMIDHRVVDILID